jgi:hypothetical protein
MNGIFYFFMIVELVTFLVFEEPDSKCDGNFKLVPKWDKCFSVPGGLY